MELTTKQIYMRNYRKANKEKLALQDKKKTQERRVKHKLKAIEYLGGKCEDCGLISEFRGVYDFHHKEPIDKDFDPGSILHYSWIKVKKELDKCVLLCANCHRIRHEKESN